MRLPPEDYGLLVQAAREHGVAPATLARIIVVRTIRTQSQD